MPNLVYPLLMASALKGSGQPQLDDLIGQAEGDDASSHREDIGVVVFAREARGEQIVTERRTASGNLFGGDLLALTAAPYHDAAIGPTLYHDSGHVEADCRIVH